jgi:glutathione S-transferase
LLTLYYAPGACSMAPHIALEETGATFAAIRIDEVGVEHLTEAYRKINPRSKVPALKLDDGTVITENIAIQTCIARLYPNAELLPPDPVAYSAHKDRMLKRAAVQRVVAREGLVIS